jgi:hypothetical protein
MATDEVAPPNEWAVSRDAPTLHETHAEYARKIPNYGYDPGSPASTWAFYPVSYDFERDPDYLERQALFDSFSPGLRTQIQGVVAEQIAAWEKELERAEAQRKRDEAEYAVFIEKHLRRQYRGRAQD